jgi:hypothetical protein
LGTLPPQPTNSITLARKQRSRSKGLVFGTLFAALATILLWNCGKGAYHNYRLSSAAIDRFHQQLDQSDYETIYGDATEEFRRAGTREDELKFLEMVHQKMGNSGKMSIKGFHVNWQNGQTAVDEVFDTQFALGQARESFIWVIEHDQPRLQTYRIYSSNLR